MYHEIYLKAQEFLAQYQVAPSDDSHTSESIGGRTRSHTSKSKSNGSHSRLHPANNIWVERRLETAIMEATAVTELRHTNKFNPINILESLRKFIAN